MKRNPFPHFAGIILFVFLAFFSLFLTMFISYRNYSDKIGEVRSQIKIGMNRSEIEKVLGKPDEEHISDIPGTYAHWSPSLRYGDFLELFKLAKYEDYNHLSIELSRNGVIEKSF